MCREGACACVKMIELPHHTILGEAGGDLSWIRIYVDRSGDDRPKTPI
jgi:hypothetical protein